MAQRATTPVPDNMTGGVDLTGTTDLDGPGIDSLIGLNRQPEVLQTYTGGHGPLAGSVHLEVGGLYKDQESKDVAAGLHNAATAFDSQPVRVVPASRFRTSRYTLAGGQSLWIAQRDARRTHLGISIFDPLAGVGYLYVGTDLATVLSMGFALGTVPGAPSSIVMTHGDSVAIGTPSTNPNPLTVSIAFEIQE